MTRRWLAYGAALAGAFSLSLTLVPPARAMQALNCVQFVKIASDFDVSGDAWMWWHRSAGEYARGAVPRKGSILVFKRTRQMRYGHVALVTAVPDRRTVLIDHANWSSGRGGRGRIERSVRVIDVSAENDWSEVRVWYEPAGSFGRVNPTYGFIYGDG